MKKIKLTRDQIKALEYLEYDLNYSVEKILFNHLYWPNNWEGKASSINGLDYRFLHSALYKGFEVEEKQTLEEVLDIVRKENMAEKMKSTREELELEIDYQLSSLHEAMQNGNIKEIDKIKVRLGEIHGELGL